MIRPALLALALALATPALAHGPEVGPHGGKSVDAGPWHAELVLAGETATLHLTDPEGAPVDTAALSATAVLIVGGTPLRLSLAPGPQGTLTAPTGRPVTPEEAAAAKGAVNITGNGATVPAMF